jgi:pectin methylesterase-like acyl-CoA thioesterase/pectate lyase
MSFAGVNAAVTTDPNITPDQDTTYSYDFEEFKSYTDSNPIDVVWSSDGLLKVNGGGTMFHHQSKHGLRVFDGNSFEIKVAGNAYITFELCQYSESGEIIVSGGAAGSQLSKESINIKGATDGEQVDFIYSGDPTTLTFTINGKGYIHGIIVENTSQNVDITGWAQKDFSIKIDNKILDVMGAVDQTEEAYASINEGKVYYALSESTYVNLDLGGQVLKTALLENLSPNVVSDLSINDLGEIVVTFADQSTYPYEYLIKIQDTSIFVEPNQIDSYFFNLADGIVVPKEFSKATPISDFYTTNNGMLTIAKGNGTKNPYYHGSHGITSYNGNYFDIKVSGSSDVSFSLCEYSKGDEILEVTNLAPGGTGAFDQNKFKTSIEGEMITYSYSGDPTTLRFTLTLPTGGSEGENYLHSIKVTPTGEIEDSPVANVQLAMPYEIDDVDALSVIPIGHRLYVSQTNTDADFTGLQNVSYYVFDARAEATTIEADIQITSIGSSSRKGVFIGMFEDIDPMLNAATIGPRGDGRIRNMYSKNLNDGPSAGSTDKTYSVGDVIHLVSTKDTNGWTTETTVNKEMFSVTLDYSKIPFINDVNTSVKHGFAFADVDVIITNLILKDEIGNILYDQNDAYKAEGTAPTVTEVYEPILSTDRKEVTINWDGDVAQEDGAYVVELSTDGGITYTTLSKVTEKTYTVEVKNSGSFKFKVYGICGDEITPALESNSIEVLEPLADPTVKIESGDGVLTLTWNAIDNATIYEIYRKSSEETKYTLIDQVSDYVYVDRNVVNETPYYYYIVAKSATNSANGSVPILSVPSAGRIGEYVYEDEATEIFITKKSFDTVYNNTATLQGVVGAVGVMQLIVNDQVQEVINIEGKGSFDLVAQLIEGRNDVNLIFTDQEGKVTRKSFNFVYITNYHIIVDDDYSGVEGAELPDYPGVKVFSTVQGAVDSLPSNNQERTIILIKEGNYVEHLRVNTPMITLIGEDRDKVKISFYDPVLSPEGGSMSDRNAVYIKSGATGFSAENLTFENTYEYLGDGTKSNESADALRVDADLSTFINVKLVGYQDTLCASDNRQYYYKSYILGNIDFIYGQAQALFDDTDIVFRYNSNKNSGYVTAPRTDASKQYGYIFNNSRIIAEAGASGSKYLLARPWGPDGAATFINTYMSKIINTENPYSDMSGNLAENARFYEYFTYGAGFAINSNRPQISKNQAEEMLTTTFLGWDPYASIINNATKYVGNIITLEEEKFIESEYINDKADPDSTDDTGLGKYSLEGYATEKNVTGGGLLLETSNNYYQVATAEEFLDALTTVKVMGKPSIIEITNDIPLGSVEIGNVLTNYSSIIKAHKNQPLIHPTLLKTGISTLELSGMSNLTIFSKNGAKITHATINMSNSSNIIIRNLVFDEIWEWDEYTHGDYDRNDWDYITIQEGSTGIWLDHITFYKAYDGVVDIKKAVSSDTTNVTISWSAFLPGSEGTFFDDMMDLLEANPEQYPYYYELIMDYDMTKEEIRKYAYGQKKTHLIGASDTEANISNLWLTLANNYYKDSMDRMPRIRGGYAHVYNTIMDASTLYELKTTLINPNAAGKVVSNGAIATNEASLLVENSYINGIIKALLSGNGSSPGGYIDAINSLYYLNGVETELLITDHTGQGLTLDVDKFKTSLPYSYHLYDAGSLDTLVLPYVGAGSITMSTTQWEKTKYNDNGFSDDSPSDNNTDNGDTDNDDTDNENPISGGGSFSGSNDDDNNSSSSSNLSKDTNSEDLAKKAIEELSNTQKEIIIEMFGEYLPYTRLGNKVFTIEQLKKLTNNIFTEKELEAILENLQVLEEIGIDLTNYSNVNTLEAIENHEFKDVEASHWANASIKKAASLGLVAGMPGGNFAPNQSLQVADTFAFLDRVLLLNNVTESILPRSAVEKYIKDKEHWAFYNVASIGSKLSENTLSTISELGETPIPRELLAQVLYEVTKGKINATREVPVFLDTQNSPYKEAIDYCVSVGLLYGTSETKMEPQKDLTRAEMTAIIIRLNDLLR